MSDNIAILEGYTKGYLADSADGMYSLFILVKPGTDLDSSFKAWDSDNQMWTILNGWNWSFEETND